MPIILQIIYVTGAFAGCGGFASFIGECVHIMEWEKIGMLQQLFGSMSYKFPILQ